MKRLRALPVTHLGFFAHQEFQPVILFGIIPFQQSHEPLNAVVFVSECIQFHQILVDGHGVAAESYLFLDPFPVGFTGRQNMFGHFVFRSRWPGWGILNARGVRAGGHFQTDGGF
jgi:hypothetical protein